MKRKMNEKYLSMSVVKLESIESINEFFMNFEHFNSLDRSVLYVIEKENFKLTMAIETYRNELHLFVVDINNYGVFPGEMCVEKVNMTKGFQEVEYFLIDIIRKYKHVISTDLLTKFNIFGKESKIKFIDIYRKETYFTNLFRKNNLVFISRTINSKVETKFENINSYSIQDHIADIQMIILDKTLYVDIFMNSGCLINIEKPFIDSTSLEKILDFKRDIKQRIINKSM